MSRSMELSRAELVRKRRQQQPQKRVSKSSEPVTRPLAPITARGGTTYASPRRTMRTTPNRRFQAALSMPGVEVHMPAISFTGPGVKWRLVSFALCVLLGAGLYLVWSSPELGAAAPEVSGNRYISSDEINGVLNVAGVPVFMLVPADLESRLRLNFPELDAARVNAVLPNRVLVEVSERKPVITWQQGGGYTWIDAGGVAFRPRGTAQGLITVEALAPPISSSSAASQVSDADPLTPKPFIGADMVDAILTLAPSVPQGSSLVYDPKYGLGWADSRGWQAYFGGDASNMALKLQVYQSLADTLIQKGITPVFISVQYPNAPYYRVSQ